MDYSSENSPHVILNGVKNLAAGRRRLRISAVVCCTCPSPARIRAPAKGCHHFHLPWCRSQPAWPIAMKMGQWGKQPNSPGLKSGVCRSSKLGASAPGTYTHAARPIACRRTPPFSSPHVAFARPWRFPRRTTRDLEVGPTPLLSITPHPTRFLSCRSE